MTERIRELVIQIQHSARAIDRDVGLLYEETKKPVEPSYPIVDFHEPTVFSKCGQPVGLGNEAEDKFNAQ